ncbi:PAS domain-containing protein [Mucilaginibacter sp. Bleaf8]|uniref:ATP-binding protein n=1 Tax=Mucilaginibacter sp. Bleaf8 TaxID=2834430 RepID=UPI001BD12CD9|nr:ATP-binding protein [Mucilaginibacter sp. Bleaf8]MBS7563239.1 PAS domain-containing protein [Mucilaginibacter sp. Bleaf8]
MLPEGNDHELNIYATGEMADRIRSHAWASSPVGPVSAWPLNLLNSVNLILDSGFPMLIWWGSEKIQFYNDAYRQILGSGPGGKHPKTLGQKGETAWIEVWPVIGPLIDKVFETGKAVYQEDVLIPIYRNGQLDDVYWTFSYNPIRGVGGKTEGILVVCNETTHKYQLMQENEQRLQHILDTMAEGVVMTNNDGKVVYANRMARKIMGYSDEEIKARTYNDSKWQNQRISGEPLPYDEHPVAITLATKKPVYDEEIAIHPPNGERFYVSISAAPQFDAAGQLTGCIATFTDVTNRVKLMQQKDDFISVASHELKTPITSLKASLQLMDKMKDHPSKEMLPKLIMQSRKSIQRVSTLIDDLLNVSRFQQAEVNLNKTTFVLSQLLNTICNPISIIGKQKVKITGDLNLKVHADEHRIDQVVTNLVNNALKYAPESLAITLSIEQVGNMAKVCVIDYGPGIPQEKTPHLFGRYYRAEGSGSHVSGLGLGLYISAEIIKRHGGEIGVKSELGRGSTFWFTLPIDGNEIVK